MAWTIEQENAIKARGSSVLVSAAAGSGKTSVLVERLIQQLADTENRIPADKMIVVTFTRDAALEMRQRLSAELSKMIEQKPDDQWLNSQHMLLQSARISTIHSFCFDLIRDNINELELPANFRIMDENESKLLLKKEITETVNELYNKNPETAEMLYNSFCNKDDTELEELVLKIYEFVTSVPYGMNWLKNCRNSYIIKNGKYEKFLKQYSEKLKSVAQTAKDYVSECQDIMAECGFNKAVEIIDDEYTSIVKITDMINNGKMSFADIRKNYIVPEFKRLTIKELDEKKADRVKALRDIYKKLVKDEITAYLRTLVYSEEDFKRHYEIIDAFIDIITELEKKMWRAKTEKGCIGFDDAESLAIKLLSVADENGNIKKSSLAEELSEYYKIIMIDEFQDTNNNQDLIFKLLSHNGTPEKTGDNVFMVGDVKQSIYGFRLANPKNFISAMEASVKYGEQKNNENVYIKLNRNFRSSEAVVNTVNFIFRSIMSNETGEVDYNEEEELIKGTQYPELYRDTEVALLEIGDNDKLDVSAKYIAKKICTMLNEKVQVSVKDGKTRDCKCSDFCILLRKNDFAQAYVDELSKLGISAYCEESKGYLKSREISLLINLLRITDNPLIDTALAAVMMSPVFMITDDEFARIRLFDRKQHIYNIICAVANSEKPVESEYIDEALGEKIKKIYETLNIFRMYAATMDVVSFIRKIYDYTDFISSIRKYSDSDRKRANLRALLEYAKAYTDASDEGVSGFLRYIDRMTEMNGDFRQGKTVSGAEDVVMIKTIHKSKGLEYPFVFLANTEHNFNREDSKRSIQLHFKEGIGFRLQNRKEFQKYTTLPFEIINSVNFEEQVSEEMRLFYVALTRAKERLFIPLKIDKGEKEKLAEYGLDIIKNNGVTPELSAKANCMEDWLLMSLMTHQNGYKLREWGKCDNLSIMSEGNSNFKIDFPVIDANELYPEDNEEKDMSLDEKEVAPDFELVKKLTEKFNFKYDMALSEIPAKVSVSEISKNHDIFGRILKRPAFLREKGKMTGSEKGTVIHSILQHAEFTALKKNTDAEISRLVKLGFLTEFQKNSIKTEMITAFTESEIFERILDSNRVMREKKFLMRASDLELDDNILVDGESMVQGIIDLYFEENNELVLIDYKTDNVNDMSVLVENYSGQLMVYKAALEKSEGKKVKQTFIYSLKLGKTQEIL